MINFIKKKLPLSFKRKYKRLFQDLWQTFVYRNKRSRFNSSKIRHVVFVCTGNICRSAFSEYALKKKVSPKNVKIESCGLDVTQAICSPIEAVTAGRSYDVDLSEHRSKGIMDCDLLSADLIVPMDYGHYRRLISDYPQYKMKICLLRDFSTYPYRFVCNIHDPFGLAQEEFECCFKNIQRCLKGIAKIC